MQTETNVAGMATNRTITIDKQAEQLEVQIHALDDEIAELEQACRGLRLTRDQMQWKLDAVLAADDKDSTQYRHLHR
jgi:chromosome segregation ATPase